MEKNTTNYKFLNAKDRASERKNFSSTSVSVRKTVRRNAMRKQWQQENTRMHRS